MIDDRQPLNDTGQLEQSDFVIVEIKMFPDRLFASWTNLGMEQKKLSTFRSKKNDIWFQVMVQHLIIGLLSSALKLTKRKEKGSMEFWFSVQKNQHVIFLYLLSPTRLTQNTCPQCGHSLAQLIHSDSQTSSPECQSNVLYFFTFFLS